VSTVVACILFLGVIVYAIFGGADFGAGIWDLLAGGTRRGRKPRQVIDRSIGPVWEANHVWLIFVFVVLWTAFPAAYASITLTLFVPLALAALGIVLRGASFAFRHAVYKTEEQRVYGAFFAFGSLLVPFAFGCVAGAIATGRVPAGGRAGDPWGSWVNPTSLLGGVLAVVAVSYLSSVFLLFDAGRVADDEMVEYFRRRAVIAAVVAGVVALAGIAILHADATYLFDELTSRALPLVLVSAIGGIASLVLLLREEHRFARVAAVGAVGGILAAWGVAQWPYIVPTDMTVKATAAPSGTLTATVVVFLVACVTIVPSIGLLYWLDQQDVLPEEGGDDGIELDVAPGAEPGMNRG